MSVRKALGSWPQVLIKSIVNSRVVLWILFAGTMGGSVRLLFDQGSGWTHYLGHPVSGALAAYVFIILIANTDLSDLRRVVALALVAGVAHIPVWNTVTRQVIDGSLSDTFPDVDSIADPLSQTKDRIDEKPSEDPTLIQPSFADDSPSSAEQRAARNGLLQRVRYLGSASRQLALGDTASGEFSDFADQWYRIDLSQEVQRDVFTIVTLRSISGADADTEIVLFDSGLSEIGSDDDCGVLTSSRLTLPLEPGEYVLRVSSFDQQPGEYRVVVLKGDSAIADCRPGPADYLRSPPFVNALNAPPNWASADRLTTGAAIQGIFRSHVYRLSLDDRGYYTISTTGEESGADTVVELFADDGVTLLGLDDDGGQVLYYSQLRRYLDAGVYYVRVSRVGGGESYTLSVEPN